MTPATAYQLLTHCPFSERTKLKLDELFAAAHQKTPELPDVLSNSVKCYQVLLIQLGPHNKFNEPLNCLARAAGVPIPPFTPILDPLTDQNKIHNARIQLANKLVQELSPSGEQNGKQEVNHGHQESTGQVTAESGEENGGSEGRDPETPESTEGTEGSEVGEEEEEDIFG